MKNFRIAMLMLLLFMASCSSSTTDDDTITGEIVAAPQTIEEEHVLGLSDAPIEMIEYSDFECPYSKHFHDEILPQLKAEFIDTGRARLVFRHLPLNSVHPNAHKAAEATECAGIQGRFWGMHDSLFEHGVSGGVDAFREYAGNLSLDIERFNACIDSDFTRQEVIDDFYSGIDAGVTGTPSFIVNGELAPQLKSYEEFSEYLEQMTANMQESNQES